MLLQCPHKGIVAGVLCTNHLGPAYFGGEPGDAVRGDDDGRLEQIHLPPTSQQFRQSRHHLATARLKNQLGADFSQYRHVDIWPASAITRPLCDTGPTAGEFRCQQFAAALTFYNDNVARVRGESVGIANNPSESG